MSLIKQCQFIQLPQYPRCQEQATVTLEVKRPGDRKRREDYCGQHSGLRRVQYGQLHMKVKVVAKR